MSELERVVAYVFRGMRREAMSKREFRHHVSLGLRWYSPAEAAALLQRALDAGFLQPDGDAVRPSFDVEDVDLPLGFKGTRRALEEPVPLPGPGAPRPGPPQAGPVSVAAPGPSPAPAVQAPDARWPGMHAALLGEAPPGRVAALREASRGLLGEDVARLVALHEQGIAVREAAADALAALMRRAAAAGAPPTESRKH